MDESMDDFFRKRSYQGEIYKTGSPGNRSIAQYTSTPEEMKAEQERIEQELRDMEQLIRHEAKAVVSPPRKATRRSNSKSTGTATSATQTMRDRRY